MLLRELEQWSGNWREKTKLVKVILWSTFFTSAVGAPEDLGIFRESVGLKEDYDSNDLKEGSG